MSINAIINDRHGSSVVQMSFFCLPVLEVAPEVEGSGESITTFQSGGEGY